MVSVRIFDVMYEEQEIATGRGHGEMEEGRGERGGDGKAGGGEGLTGRG